VETSPAAHPNVEESIQHQKIKRLVRPEIRRVFSLGQLIKVDLGNSSWSIHLIFIFLQRV
jgi:hypothetical protein